MAFCFGERSIFDHTESAAPSRMTFFSPLNIEVGALSDVKVIIVEDVFGAFLFPLDDSIVQDPFSIFDIKP